MSEIIDFSKLTLAVANLFNFKAEFCTVANLHIDLFWISWSTYYQPCHTLTGWHLLADSNVLAAYHVHVLSYIEADHAIANMNELTCNVPLQSMNELCTPRYSMLMIVYS